MARHSELPKGEYLSEVKRSNRKVLVYRRRNPVTGKSQKLVIGNAADFPRGSDKLQRAIDQIRSRIEKSPTKLAPTTMQQLIDHYKQHGLVSWKADEEDGKSFATISRLQTVLKVWIAPYWGKHLLSEVEALDVKNWLKSLPLARSYKCKIRNTLSALFSHARLYKFYSPENPIAEVKQSGKRKMEPCVLSKTQLEELLSNLGIREQLLVLTAATTGLRRSELAGLKWSDMDLVNGWISVNRSVDNNLENPCKTEASRKAVPLDLRIVPFFQRWYEVSLFKAPDDYVFAAGCNRAGGKRGKQPISLSVVFRYHIRPVADRLAIKPAVFGWHTFRRSFASMVVGSTKDVKAAQELMRHSTSKLTLDLYAQALPENKVAASKAIAGSLLLPQPSTCTAVQSGQGAEEPVKLNAVNQSPSSSPA